jgi:isopentenyl phosphate kinase
VVVLRLASFLKILKLGGSAITDKTKPFSVRKDVVDSLAREVLDAKPKRLIIIHGGGSFGHPLAKKYRLVEGFKNKTQLTGFAETRRVMMMLHKIIVDTFTSHGVNVVSVPPLAFIRTRNRRISFLDKTVLSRLLGLGLTPILFGDVVLDEKLGFTILSGDQIAAKLAVVLQAERIVLATDVDGVFTSNPKTDPNAKLLRQLSLSKLGKIVNEKSKPELSIDVTGTMIGKLKEMVPAVNRGVKVFVVNALKSGRVSQALKSSKIEGTTLKP